MRYSLTWWPGCSDCLWLRDVLCSAAAAGMIWALSGRRLRARSGGAGRAWWVLPGKVSAFCRRTAPEAAPGIVEGYPDGAGRGGMGMTQALAAVMAFRVSNAQNAQVPLGGMMLPCGIVSRDVFHAEDLTAFGLPYIM